jgi:regulator of sirC expression with transglutaminase-like and TPR domain
MSLLDYLQRDPECRSLAEGAVHAVAPLLEEPDPEPLLRTLDAWALELAARMPLPWSLHGALDALNHFLFHEQGLHGDRTVFGDPGGALLPRVLARRTGLPVALSIVWIDVARRLGLDAVGVALPGHFITGLRHELGVLLFDPFAQGRAVGEEEAARLVRRATGGRVAFEPGMLEPVPHRAILRRLVRNLHVRFLRAGELDEALWTSLHLVLLAPEEAEGYRERALVRLHRGERDAARLDLLEAARLSGGDPEVERLLRELRRDA